MVHLYIASGVVGYRTVIRSLVEPIALADSVDRTWVKASGKN